MQVNYKRITIILAVALTLSLLITFSVLAGNIDPPSAPTDPASQMYTLEDIYNRLSSNGDAVIADEFTEPTAGPGSTMHTLDDIYTLSYPSRVRVTGQTECYDTAGATIACAGTGQDGELQKGVDWPNPRFTVNGDNNFNGSCLDAGDTCDGTVTDNLTGLVWLRNADCWVSGTSWGWRDWPSALTNANTLASGSCGLSDGSIAGDWRLPNVTELTSLLHYGVEHPSVPNTTGTGGSSAYDPFINLRATAFYWSSTSVATYHDEAWRVGLGLSSIYNGNKTAANRYSIGWAVRDQ